MNSNELKEENILKLLTEQNQSLFWIRKAESWRTVKGINCSWTVIVHRVWILKIKSSF